MTTKPKHMIKCLLAAVVTLSLAFTFKQADDPIDKLVAALQKWSAASPQEKVYLHLDRPYYALGDTIWFKGYVTTGAKHQLSAMSGALYVDLIDERDSIVRKLKLPVTTGMVMGNMTLDDNLTEGNYRIRAYTQWMRNAGEEYFFDETFTIGSVYSSGIVTRADYNYKTVDGKNVLAANLTYTDENGKPLINKSVIYRIYIDKKLSYTKSTKTDANGVIALNIANDNKIDLAGAYIRSTLSNAANKEINKITPIKAMLAQSDVQIFPEGGNLVNGVTSRVGFKAVGIDGLGLAISGKVLDNDNKEITAFSTLYAGMGSFVLRPEQGKTYTAKVAFADGSIKSIPLQVATDGGYVLGVYQPGNDSVLVRINTAQQQVAQPKNVGLIVQAGGESVFATNVIMDQPMKSVWLDRKAFPSGIAQFTLFDAMGKPVNERVAFIKSNNRMELDIKPGKSSYRSKEPVSMALMAKDGNGKATAANFSVSVVDESKVPSDEADETSIFSSLLLSSDIKGYIEKPNYYFMKDDEPTNTALDNLMLTQGYRRFKWTEIEKLANSKPAFELENVGTTISGKVQTLTHKPLYNATVTLLSVKAKVTKFTSTDSAGRFRFDGIFMTDSIKFAVQARNPKGKDKVEVILDSVPKIQVARNPNMGDVSTNISGRLKAYIDAGKKQDELNTKMGRMDQVRRLREVSIKAVKDKVIPLSPNLGLRIPEGHEDKTYTMKETDVFATLGLSLNGKLGPVMFHQGGAVQFLPHVKLAAMSTILNGRLITNEQELIDIYDGAIDPMDVVKVDAVYAKDSPLYKMLNTGPVLLIYTKLNFTRRVFTPSLVNISPKGFNKAREFYSPRFDRPGVNKNLPDMRNTIYWNPYLKTYAGGRASMNYFNGDGPANYRVTVEGINADGHLGRKVFRYTVDGELGNTNALPAAFNDDNFRTVSTALDSMQKRLPIEKVYLHTDKPYYNIGDTLWFKAYVTDATRNATKVSGLLYVELDDDSGQVARRVSIPIKEGIGSARIPLPATIFQEGGYTLRAYTNWQQNFGDSYFFTQRFYMGVPAQSAWLVNSTAAIDRVAEKNRLDVDIKLKHGDRTAVALTDVEVRIYEGRYYLFKEKMRTGIDGSLKFSKELKDKVDGRNLRVQVSGLEKAFKDKMVQVPLAINRHQNIDLQFMPEGGNLVAGLKSVVGFKALGEDGKSTSVAGSIYDSKGVEVVPFATTHKGMGVLEFTPKAGEKYMARLSQPAVKSFDLPKVNALGTVMHVGNNEQDSILTVNIAGVDKLPGDSAVYLIGTSGGKMYYSQQVDRKQTTLTVSKEQFPTGVARLTLLKGKRTLNERAVFIDNKDQLQIKVLANKPRYNKRDSVGLEIEIKDKSGNPVQGSFSLAVTDNSQVKADTIGSNSINTRLILSADLKGHIEDPGYYIERKDKQAWADLDNLLLTQGWTGYDWKDIFAPAKPLKFRAEKELVITGQVTNLSKKPVPNAEVLISSQKPSFVTTTLTDADGRYSFKNLPPIDTGSFFLQGNNAKGKARAFGNISVDKIKAAPIPETFRSAVMPWYVNSDTAQLNFVKRVAQKADLSNIKGMGKMLKNVDIKNVKVIKGTYNRNGPGRQDMVFDEQDIKESAVDNLYQLVRQKLPGMKITMERGMPTLRMNGRFVVILVDGSGLPIMMDQPPTAEELFEELSSFKIAQFKGMEVMYTENNLVKYQQPRDQWIAISFPGSVIAASEETLKTGGATSPWYFKTEYRPGYLEHRANVASNKVPDVLVVDITTKGGSGFFRNPAPNAVTYRPLPVMKPEKFYRPKYKVNEPVTGMPDYRATIHWEPNILTDLNGKAKVSFYTSDLPSNYTLNLQGITHDGDVGSLIIKLPKVPRMDPQ
ncbi:carboxypeptidase-like regulatory domain-containing protein [Mucilaginibacter myungsuensis]|uniref:Carboxypeptidase regulatory-like domain-containing protein n=1 Tax=Mucilaginibacter myungsuensis TaxID=649104 RepID=A0A929PXV1_9SPHI|nr:carboxypeptidase-like regulatory domain-containing protein [Mucilaginibacter myungsuensis]MBE9663561.1 carboxypeptidase regulatory-like domain-containing protein [Mucilaginibacter myungsuensis]MDN3599115.1 carboxypeptidase regulatory-like domain-containing protein [Mucilaginibacter myungsuensis]